MHISSIGVGVLLVLASDAFAQIDLELGAALTTKGISAPNQKEVSVPSKDIEVYCGYRFTQFSLSMGVLVSRKSYDTSQYSKQLSVNSRVFYNDPIIFPTPVPISSIDSSGYWKGWVLGPQISVGYKWRGFEPYFRLSYQVGDLKSLIAYNTTGAYQGKAISYDYKLENEIKASLSQYSIGLRYPVERVYYFVDLGIEKMSAEVGPQTISTRSVDINGESTQRLHFKQKSRFDTDGDASKLGIGMSF